MGILVTESVRGEGGVLRNKDGKRFMYDDIPDNYKSQTSTDPEEGWRYTQNDKNAKRPPELLTRDHVARCINREVKAGRGSPHGGVFLDISWIKEKIPNSAGAHQTEAAFDVSPVHATGEPRHHEGADGNRPDHALRDGRHPRERRDAGDECSRTCLRRANAPPVCTARTVSAAIRFPTSSSSASAPANTPRNTRRKMPPAQINDAEIEAAYNARRSSRSNARAGGGTEGPYQVQYDLQNMMQELVGIVRLQNEMEEALDGIAKLKARAAKVAVQGHCEYNPGWHTAIDLKHLLTISEAITMLGAGPQGKPRRPFPRGFPEQGSRGGEIQHRHFQGGGWLHEIAPRTDSGDAGRFETSHRGDEMNKTVTFRIWRGDANGGKFVDYTTEITEGLVVLDVVHKIQAHAGQRPRRAAGIARPANAAPARRKSTACPSSCA